MEVLSLLLLVLYLASDVVTQYWKSRHPESFWLRDLQLPWMRRLPVLPHVRVYPTTPVDSSKTYTCQAYTSHKADTRQP